MSFEVLLLISVCQTCLQEPQQVQRLCTRVFRPNLAKVVRLTYIPLFTTDSPMPGPGNKRKLKGNKNPKSDANAAPLSPSEGDGGATTAVIQCLTVEEDEITLCGRPATEGYPRPERCKAHHGQYRIMYKKYKDASKVVDDIKRDGNLPTKEQVERYADWHIALEKSRWVRKYLEAIRVEKTGREIHQSRFFLKGEYRKCFFIYES